jgi:NAD(P)-dependent dehydrogenase (short-subunit alcohol dehydrogenase family)
MVERQLAAGDYTVEEMAEPYPLGRIGQPAEIAHVICSVASPLNSYMTGAVIAVDGGLTAK